MNDFFTELDSDLRNVKPTPEIQEKQPNPIKKDSQIIESSWKIPVKIPSNVPRNITPVSPVRHEVRTQDSQKKEITDKRYDTALAHVNDIRSQMMQSGVVTIVFKADEKTKTLLGHLKLETRGFVYLDEVREIHKMVIKKARTSYEDTVKDVPDIEEKDLIKIIRRDLEIFLLQKVKRTPVIIPIIIYI